MPTAPVRLLDGLISHWKLEESSGTRNDSHGTNHLTDNNTVTGASGKLGNAAQFTRANGEWLSITDNPSLSIGAAQSFTWACWIYPDTLDLCSVIQKNDDFIGAVTAEYELYISGRPRFTVGDGVSNSADTDGPSINTGEWSLCIAWYSHADAKIYLQVNNGALYEAAVGFSLYDSTRPLAIGNFSGGGTSFAFNGRMDSVSFWKRALTTAERAALWNNGSGLPYESFLRTPITARGRPVFRSVARYFPLLPTPFFGSGTPSEPPASGVSGSAAVTLGALTSSAAGTVDVSGATSATLAALTSSSAGAVAVTGSGGGTLAAVTSSSAGAVAVAGTLSGTLAAVTGSSAGTVEVAGSTSQTLGALTSSAAGTVDVAGTLTQTLGALTVSSEGTVASGPTGALNVTLGALTAASEGTVAISGTASVTLGGLTSSATGAVAVTGTGGGTLGGATVASAGIVEASGTVAQTLGQLTGSSAGQVAVAGSVSVTLGGVTAASAGAVAVAGSVNQTLGALTVVATAGSIVENVPNIWYATHRPRTVVATPRGRVWTSKLREREWNSNPS